MKRNLVAWAALLVGTAALLNNSAWIRPTRAIQEIPAEGQKVAEQLSAAFNAVAEFARPSVVQITTERRLPAGINPRGRPFRGPDGQPREMTPEQLRQFQDQFRRFFEDLPGAPDEGADPKSNRPRRPSVEPMQQQPPGPRLSGDGSGFVFDDKGHILTNNHVVSGAESISVLFHDGKRVSAKLVAADARTDLAVIKVESTDYRALPVGNSDALKVGDWVVALGSPFGLAQSVTAGIVSAKGRGNLGILGRDGFGDFLQTDAAINPGNSGGPLVDVRGRVVGINSAIATSTRANSGVGFAIPINFAVEVANRLIKDGKIKRAQIGVLFGAFQPDMARELDVPADTQGIVVGNVLAGGPADKAGLRPDDVITRLDGVNIGGDTESFRRKVADSAIGTKVQLEGFRDGKPLKLELTLGDADEVAKLDAKPLPRDEQAPGAVVDADADGFGLEVEPLTAEAAQQFGFKAETKGLLVVGVKADSPAAKAGVEVGNVIAQVGKTNVITPEEFREAVGDAKEILVRLVGPNSGEGKLVTLKK